MIDLLEPIGLDELLAGADLQDRVDRKYVVPLDVLEEAAAALAGTHRVLEIDGARRFGYRTTYYDTPDLLCLREHVQRRRRRFKFRKRRYLETETSMLEVKLKGRRGMTVKQAVACDPADPLDAAELAFLRDQVWRAYAREAPVEALGPVLDVACRRVTLAAPQLRERVTCDLELELGGRRLRDGLAIVETKSVGGLSSADRVLLRLGQRPVGTCSKYCLGMSFSQAGVRANAVRPLHRHFEPLADPRPLAGAAVAS
jgi:hypothetical protein